MDIKQEFSKQITKINMKTSSFLEENKIRTYISTLENEIRELKLKVGENGYGMWRAGAFRGEELFPIFQEINGRYMLIRQQEEKLRQLAQQSSQVLGESQETGPAKVFCPKCGAVCQPNMNFCKACGTKLR